MRIFSQRKKNIIIKYLETGLKPVFFYIIETRIKHDCLQNEYYSI